MFGLILATLSLIYFVTLVWGPDEKDEPGSKNYLKDLGDQPKAESTVEPGEEESSEQEVSAPKMGTVGARLGSAAAVHQAGLDVSALRPDELHDLQFVVRDSETRQALAGATIHVAKAAGNGRVLASFRVDAEGNGKLRRLPHAQYRFWVEAPGYHASEPRAAEVPLDGTRFEVQLTPAAQLVGVFEGLDGDPRSHGILHLSRVAEPEVVVVRPNANGRFVSPELAGGKWQVAWMPHSRAQPAPGMSTELTLPTGERTLLEVTLSDGAADPRHKREPGIRRAIVALQ